MADLMDEVQRYQCLCDRFSREYNNMFMKVNCWTAIGEKFGMSP